MIQIARLITIALKSDHREYKHAAAIVKGGNILAQGYNHGAIHAEINAIRKIWPNKLRGCGIVSIRVNKQGLANARPCEICYRNIKNVGIKTLIYSDALGRIIRERI